MRVEIHAVAYGANRIEFRLRRRERSTLEITVEPDGTVMVVAPVDAPLEEVVSRVQRRARWILTQQDEFAQFRPRTPARRYVPGETHRYLGRQYRIRVPPAVKILPGAARVKMVRGFLEVHGADFDDTPTIEKEVKAWFLERARIHLPRRIEVNRQRFADPECVRPAGLRLERMPTRWGSMSAGGRLLLNPDLMSAPMECIDYVVTHELCHLLVPSHSRRFYELQESILPDWERRKQRLERALA